MENPESHGEWVLIFQKGQQIPIVYALGLCCGIMLCTMILSFLTCVEKMENGSMEC